MGRVLKAPRDAAAPSGRVMPAVLFDAKEQAAALVADARAKAETILQAATDDAGALRAQARDEGERQAHVTAATLLIQAARVRDEALVRAEQDTLDAALTIARKVVGEQITLSPERVTAIVTEAIDRARRARTLVIRVHPDDLAAATVAVDASPIARVASVSTQGDPSLARGDCIIKTDLGELDARIAIKLEALARALGAKE